MSNNNAVATRTELPRELIDAPMTWEEVVVAHGITDADVFMSSGYKVLNKDKDALLDQPFIIREVKFTEDKQSHKAYAVVKCVTKFPIVYKGEELGTQILFTDGSTGIYAQLDRFTNDRADNGHPTPTQGIPVPNGLRKSEYLHEESGEMATTYYLA